MVFSRGVQSYISKKTTRRRHQAETIEAETDPLMKAEIMKQPSDKVAAVQSAFEKARKGRGIFGIEKQRS